MEISPLLVNHCLAAYLARVVGPPLDRSFNKCLPEVSGGYLTKHLTLHFLSLSDLYGLSAYSPSRGMLYALARMGLLPRISYRFNGEELVTQELDSPLPFADAVTDQYRAIAWIAQCEKPAVLVIDNAVVMCSPAYEAITEMSAIDWILDWRCVDGQLIHGNEVHHLDGGAQRLQEAIERSPGKQLLHHEWVARYAPDHSLRRFRGSFQYVQWGDRKGRLLVLDGTPQPVEMEPSQLPRQDG